MSLMFLMPFVACGGGAGPITWPEGFDTHSTNAAGTTCYSICEIGADGDVMVNSSGTLTSQTLLKGTWLNTGYTASNYYVEHGTLSGSPGTLNYLDEISSRVQCNADRHIGVQEATTLETHTCIVPIEFYDSAVGGSLMESVTLTLSAFKDTP